MDLFAVGVQEKFEEGWSMLPFKGKKAHYWKFLQDLRDRPDSQWVEFHYVALCGINGLTGGGIQHLNPGNFPRCERCQAALKKTKKH